MKKYLLITGLMCMATILPAGAVVKCVKLTSSTTCTPGNSASGSNWSITCGDIPIQGVAFCGSASGGTSGATRDSVPVFSSGDMNKYCWCRMISPAVSPWVYAGYSGTNTNSCVINCASQCVSRASYTSAFTQSLFGNLSN